MLLYVLGLAFLVMSLFAVGTSFILSQVQFSGVRISILKNAGGVFNGLALAKEALKDDPIWGDCKEADQYCEEKDENGLFPLYSPSLGKKLEDIKVNGVDLTVKAKVLNPSTALVVVKAVYGRTPFYYGVVFTKGSTGSSLPLVYSPSYSYVSGSYACSYFYDGKDVVGQTLPNFSIYLDSKFRWFPQILVPKSPAGDNPKEVRFITNFDTVISGSKDIDILVSTGNVSVENGAELDLVYSNGSVTIDDSSFVKEVVENGNYQYPNLEESFSRFLFEYPSYYYTYICGESCFSFGRLICAKDYLDLDTVVDNSYISVLGDCKLHLSTKKRIYQLYVGSKAVIEFEGNSSLRAKNIIVSGYGSESPELIARGSEGSSLVLESDTFIVKDGYFGCPNNYKSCFIDTNSFNSFGGKVISSILVRESMYLRDSLVVGNVFAGYLYSINSTFCNVVDSSGKEVDNPFFYDLVYAGKNLSLPSSLGEKKVVCSSEEDCLKKLEELEEE